MKRAKLRYIAPITISLLIPFGLFAATQFTGPTESPTAGNTPGVIWNMTGGGTQAGAIINIDGAANVRNVYSVTSDSTIKKNILLEPGYSFHVDQVGAATYNMGNWGSGQQPLTFGLYGDLVMHGFGGATGQRGRVDAQEYCISGANCITAWPSGGGGGITTLTAGTGVTISNPSGPTATINATDLYVNTTGDTMSGILTVNGTFASYQSSINATNNSATGYAIKGTGGNAGVLAYATDASGFGGYFQTAGASRYAYLATPNFSIYASGPGYFYNTLQVRDKVSIGLDATPSIVLDPGLASGVADVQVNGNVSVLNNRNICLGGVCRNTWPTGGSGTITGVTAGTNMTGGGTSGNVTLNVTDNWVNTSGDTMTGDLVLGAIRLQNSPKQLLIQQPVNTSGPIFYSMNGPTTGKRTYAHLSNQSVAGEFGYVNTSNQTMTHAFLSGSTYGITAYAANGSGATGGTFSYLDAAGNAQYRTDIGNSSYAIDALGPVRFTGDVALNGSTSDLSIGGKADVGSEMNLNKNVSSGVALRVNGAEALWYNGTYFSYGYGGTANYFADYVGIGVTAPTYQLQLSANSAAKPTSNVWTVASDARLKDIKGEYSKGLDEIVKLKTILYTYKKNNPYNYSSDELSVGAVAQEVQKVFPEAVSKDSRGYLQLDTNSINWASINAIKELKAENDDLKARVERLEALLQK